MKLLLVTMLTVFVTALVPVAARAEVIGCGGQQALGLLTCTTTGPAMINGASFAGDGGSSAQMQWTGKLVAGTPGRLTLDYMYTDVFNTLFAKIGMRLTIRQPGCSELQESHRDWVNPATWGGVTHQISVPVDCAGDVDYTITSRAATYSLGCSFIGNLSEPSLTFVPDE